MNVPNAKYEHVFAIVRLDSGAAGGTLPDKDLITVKKVVWTQAAAEQEVARLNQLNAGKGCLYYWQITRLESDLSDPDAASDGAEHGRPPQAAQLATNPHSPVKS
jgi:hypothetical protein